MTAGECKIGNHAGQHFQDRLGRHRVALGYADLLKRCSRPPRRGLGQTTAGRHRRRPGQAPEFIDVLEMFLADPKTTSIIMIGRNRRFCRGGRRPVHQGRGQARSEEADGRLHRGVTAPPGRRMAMHGAISPAARATPRFQRPRRWKQPEFTVSPSPARLGHTLAEKLKS